jgi:hypothetical protein
VQTLSRLARLLRLEDVMVVVLTAIVIPLFDRAVGGGATVAATSSGDPSVLTGLVGLLAVVGVGACVLTRGPDEPSPLADGQMTLQGWARFPLAAGVGIVGTETLPGLGIDGGPFVGILFLLTMVGAVAHPRLPVVPVTVRRAMVLPMVIVAAGAFDQIIGRDMGGLFADLIGGAQPEVAAFWPLILGAVAALYTMLVIAPRSIADPGASGTAWTFRFVLLVGSVVLAAFLGIR